MCTLIRSTTGVVPWGDWENVEIEMAGLGIEEKGMRGDRKACFISKI
jgi:hypothetical protein